jgi:hypothetical protein
MIFLVNEFYRPVEHKSSFAPTPAVRDEHIRDARRLVGAELAAVRYFDLSGPAEPEASWPGFDVVDYGVELETRGRRLISVTWDTPGWTVGIGIREASMRGTGVSVDADVAVSDVSHLTRWSRLVGARISDVTPRYANWHDPADRASGFWCPRVSVAFGGHTVEFLLAEARPGGVLGPSGDTVAVLFDPAELPPGF